MSFPRLQAASAVFLMVWAASARAQVPGLKLIPMPRELHAAPGMSQNVSLQAGVRIACTSCTGGDDKFASDDLSEALAGRAIGAHAASGYTIALVRREDSTFTPEMKAEGYTISTTSAAVTVTAVSAEGLFYGVQTVKQMIVGDGAQAVLTPANMRDWPAMKYRGLHDDLSRGPVPTLEFQKKMIRTLAAYKINLYSPYYEHTQQYASNPLPAPPGGGISADDARALVAYAKPYHVLIVPEQEAFGHLHHDLIWEDYAPEAETPHGTVLAPGQPASLKIIGQMFGELAALYPGPFLHIGADETVDLGTGMTRSDVEAHGLGPVYLDFLQKIDVQLAPLHRKLLFWGDIAYEVSKGDPNLLKNVPAGFKKDTIAIAWEYNPQAGGFNRYLTPLTSAGFETWVAPGVNNWSVVYPDNNYALPNIQGFVRDGQKLGSTGVLNTIWYDDGEALANSNWYGILFGAAAGWQTGESSIPAFQQSYAEVFHGDRTGALDQAQIEMMAAHAILKLQAKVGDGSDGLFWVDPMSKDGAVIAGKVRPYLHDVRVHAERALMLIAQAKSSAGVKVCDAPLGSEPGVRAGSGLGAAKTFYDASVSGAATSNLHEPDAVDALELGARKMDFLAMKFQLADEIATTYQRAQVAAVSTDKKVHATTIYELAAINGIDGRMRDIRDGYSLIRDMYEAEWLRSNRAYALRPVLEHYDYEIGVWLAKSDRFKAAQRQYTDSKTLPAAVELGIPAPSR